MAFWKKEKIPQKITNLTPETVQRIKKKAYNIVIGFKKNEKTEKIIDEKFYSRIKKYEQIIEKNKQEILEYLEKKEIISFEKAKNYILNEEIKIDDDSELLKLHNTPKYKYYLLSEIYGMYNYLLPNFIELSKNFYKTEKMLIEIRKHLD